jgi:hypothetical protein
MGVSCFLGTTGYSELPSGAPLGPFDALSRRKVH